MKFKIVADSSADTLTLSGVPFESAPLKIITTEKEYTDNSELDVYSFAKDLQNYKGKSSTSCPNQNDWLNAFGDAKYVFCVTITGTLSGSYNAALLAKQLYEEQHPDRKVFVFNTLTAGPEIRLIIEKIKELIESGEAFHAICDAIKAYKEKTGLLFMLESMKNLANNGRVSPLVAKMAGILGIRVIGKASDKGDLEPLNKCRGEQKVLETIVLHLKELGLKKGKVRIAHCFNENAAKSLRERLKTELKLTDIEIYPCGGLCSFYAEKGGMLIGFEKS